MKTSRQQSATSTTQVSLGDTDGVAIVGNSGAVTMTDAGAIKGSLDLAGRTVEGGLDLADATIETAAEVTLGILDRQNRANLEAFKQAAEQQGQSFKFAMDAGRSDVATMQQIIKGTLIVVGLLAAGVALKGLK